MAGFLFRLETVDGEPAEPATLSAAVPNWKPGGRIPLGKRTLRVIDTRWSSKRLDWELSKPPAAQEPYV